MLSYSVSCLFCSTLDENCLWSCTFRLSLGSETASLMIWLVLCGCCMSVPSLLWYYVLSIVWSQGFCCLAANTYQRVMEDCSILLFAMESELKSVLSTHQTLWGRETCVLKMFSCESLCPTTLAPFGFISIAKGKILHYSFLLSSPALATEEWSLWKKQRSFKWGETKLSLVFLFWRTYVLFLRKNYNNKKTLSTSLELKQTWYPINPKALCGKAVALDTESLDVLSGFTMTCCVSLGKLDFLSVCHLQNVDEDTCTEKQNLLIRKVLFSRCRELWESV